MTPRLVALTLAAASVLGIAGCGSDTPSSRSATVAALVKSAQTSGVQIDTACAAKVVDKFSDADYTILERSVGADSLDPKALSPAGQALVIALFDCSGGTGGGTVPPAGALTTTQSAILAQLESSLSSSGLTVDHACLTQLVTELDAAAIATQDAEALSALGARAQACVQQP